MSLPWIGLLWSRYIGCPLKFVWNTLPGVTLMARGAGAQLLVLPPSDVVPPSEPDVRGVPDAPDAAALPLLEGLPLLTAPLVAPLETLPLVARPLVGPPDALPLVGAPLVVAAPVPPPEPEELTEPDEPDDAPTEPEAEPLAPEDPEPTVAEGVFEPEHARLIVTPAQNNPERHLADMGPPQCKLQDQDGRGPASTAETKIQIPCSWTRAMWGHERAEMIVRRVWAAGWVLYTLCATEIDDTSSARSVPQGLRDVACGRQTLAEAKTAK
jgi:hypothetical protein